jgi:hypothetical protein
MDTTKSDNDSVDSPLSAKDRMDNTESTVKAGENAYLNIFKISQDSMVRISKQRLDNSLTVEQLDQTLVTLHTVR